MDLNIKLSVDEYQKTNVHLCAANFGLPCLKLQNKTAVHKTQMNYKCEVGSIDLKSQFPK